MATQHNTADAAESYDTLQKKLGQLSAMLNTIYGFGLENFEAMESSIKDHYLWACADLAEDCQKLARNISPYDK